MLTLNDFFLDKILLRKIKRQQAADEQREFDEFEEEQDGEDVDGAGDTMIMDEKPVKAEKNRSQSRRPIEEIEEDDE